MEALQRLNAARVARGERAIRIGIGIDTGPLMLGTIGGRERLSAGVIGDSANTASRIESLTKRYGAAVLVSEHTRTAAKPTAGACDASIAFVPAARRNRSRSTRCWTGSKRRSSMARWPRATRSKKACGSTRPVPRATGSCAFATALKTCPGDRAAQLYVGRCWNFIENGVPDGWDA
jgi:hypothetical protein